MKKTFIIGTCDTKQVEILYVRDLIEKMGLASRIIDIGIFEPKTPFAPDIDITALRELKKDAFANATDRGASLATMGSLLEEYLLDHADAVNGVIGLGGSGNTAVATRGMRVLPIGIPKFMVSTVASGNVAPYVGASDICMMPSLADVQGLNIITRKILGNAAHALAGAVKNPIPQGKNDRKLVGMSMFGVTTPCVQQCCELLPAEYEPVVFHATGTGGKIMEKLIESGMLPYVIDITLTEVCDLFMGGVMSAGEDRLGAIIRTGVPYVGSVGALDMVNFAAMGTVPEIYKTRNLYAHNENVTLMRTTEKENLDMGRWIGEKLNQCKGKVRFLLPEGGVSGIDKPSMPFYDPVADKALFAGIEQTVKQTENRKIIRVACNINDKGFAAEVIKNFLEIC